VPKETEKKDIIITVMPQNSPRKNGGPKSNETLGTREELKGNNRTASIYGGEKGGKNRGETDALSRKRVSFQREKKKGKVVVAVG